MIYSVGSAGEMLPENKIKVNKISSICLVYICRGHAVGKKKYRV